MSPSILLFVVVIFALVCVLRMAKISALVAFLIGGILAGPYVFNFFALNDTWTLLGNLGILFLWFMVGLEMDISRVWSMRRSLLGFGAAQVLTIVFMLFPILAIITGWSVSGAMVMALMLALSSQSQDLPLLADSGKMNSFIGKKSLSIFMFQDLLIIPLMVLLPVVAGKSFKIGATFIDVSVLSILLVVGVILIGKFLLTPLLKRVARLNSREAMLLTVWANILLWAYVMHLIGLPMGLGGFLAGMLMSETIYKNQISADMSPYTLLFIALFFVTLGLELDVPVLVSKWYIIILAVAILIAIKFAAVFMVARIRRVPVNDAMFMGLLLAQSGEFAILFLQMMRNNGIEIIPLPHQEVLTLVIILSMIISPLILLGYNKISRSGMFGTRKKSHEVSDSLIKEKPRVVICGFGRVGQIVARMLQEKNIPYVAIDTNTNAVIQGREQGLNAVYGDATNINTLRRLGLSVRNTRAVVITIDSLNTAQRVILSVRSVVPHVKIYARTRNLGDTQNILRLNITQAFPETIESAFWLGYGVLSQLGVSREEVRDMLHDMRANGYEKLTGVPEQN